MKRSGVPESSTPRTVQNLRMRSDADNPGPGDGDVDFSGYSLSQLHDLRRMLDRTAFPRNFANLTAEIERRNDAAIVSPPDAAPSPAPADTPTIGRFTRRDGWLGWALALRRRSPFFGAGAIEVIGDEVRLAGSHRTWLGVTTAGECVVPKARIRNVAIDGTAVRFEIKRRFWFSRTVIFETGANSLAQSLRAQMPDAQTAGFEKKWRESREFHDRLAAIGGRPWLTPTLVVVNLAVFAAVLIASKAPAPRFTLLMDWGANYGPLTTSGQWWRIIASAFLHGGWAHVLLNMWVLWNVGRLTERLFGTATFAFLYFASGICGAFTRIVWDPSIASVGASGAIMGLFGALLAMLLHRGSRIPRSIAFAHWPSTLVFLLFNLVGGFFDPLIDNAAHVGGLVAGALFGWVLVRPIDAAQRRVFPWRQIASAAVVAALIGAACFAHLRTAGGRASVPERYFLDRSWYSRGETENLQLWGELAMRASTGSISSDELARTFDEKIIPFWKDAGERLKREAPQAPEQKPFDEMVRNFARLRLEWAEALRDTARDENHERGADALELSKKARAAMAAVQRFSMRATLDERPRALANSRLAIRLRNFLSLRDNDCVKPPPGYDSPPVFSDSIVDGPKMRQKVGCVAQAHFASGDYPALEALISKGARGVGDLPDGGSTLGGIFNGLSDYFDHGGNEFPELMGKLSDWRRSVNDPVGADLAEVAAFRDWAWLARGGGYAKTVSPQGWELFNFRTEMAAAGLREIRTRAAGNPFWYQLALQLGIDQQADDEELDALFEEGVRKFPDYLPIYSARLRKLMPRWGGTQDKIEQFIVIAAESRRGRYTPDELYARLYATYSSMEEDEINIFAAGNADWPRVQDGFDALRRRHPRSDFILNQYANLACAAGDSEKYRSLRPVVDGRRSSTAWTEKRSLKKCDELFRSAAGDRDD